MNSCPCIITESFYCFLCILALSQDKCGLCRWHYLEYSAHADKYPPPSKKTYAYSDIFARAPKIGNNVNIKHSHSIQLCSLNNQAIISHFMISLGFFGIISLARKLQELKL